MSSDLEQLRLDATQLQQDLEVSLSERRPQPDLPEHSPQHASIDTSLLSRIHDAVNWRRVAQGAAIISAAATVYTGAELVTSYIDQHRVVANTVRSIPDKQVLNILNTPSTIPDVPASHSALPTPEKPVVQQLLPHAPTEIIIPKLGIDTKIVPVDSDGAIDSKNPWGGTAYDKIKFPIDSGKQLARYWIRTGEPNTVTNYAGLTEEQSAKAVERTVIYGHAADYGPDLLFQHLQSLQLGDTFTLVANGQSFTYRVYRLENPDKNGLVNDADVFNLPKGYRKEAALVACLPNSENNSVRIGYLLNVKPVK